MPGNYMTDMERRVKEQEDREAERRLDRVRFVWFCVGAAFAVVCEIVVELARRQIGT